MRLYSGPLSMFGAKAEIAALEKGFDAEVIMVPFDMERLYEPKHPEILRVNPKKQVPVLIDGAVEIFDSTQIFEYFEEIRPHPPLWPVTSGLRAKARLLEFASSALFHVTSSQADDAAFHGWTVTDTDFFMVQELSIPCMRSTPARYAHGYNRCTPIFAA